MSNKNDLGEEIFNMIHDAVDAMDFDGLSSNISDVFKTAGNEMGDAFSKAGKELSKGLKDQMNQNGRDFNRRDYRPYRNYRPYRRSNFGPGLIQKLLMYYFLTKGDRENTPKPDFSREREDHSQYKYRRVHDASQNKYDDFIELPGADATLKKEKAVIKPDYSGQLKALPGKYAGPFEKILGIVGTSLSGIIIAAVFLVGIFSQQINDALIVNSIFLPGLLASLGLWWHGNKVSGRVNRILKYLNIWKGKSFITFDKLAKKAGVDLKQLKKDLDYIFKKDLLYYGEVDEDDTCLILTEEAKQQYEEVKKAQQEKEYEDLLKRQEEERKQQELEAAGIDGQKFLAFQQQSTEAFKQIREYEQQIDDPDMLEKLGDFKESYSKLIYLVNEDHSTCKSLDRLVDYYIPSVLKLLSVYAKLEQQDVDVNSVNNTKQEILKSMDMMNLALDRIMDELFQDTEMDVSADVKVMEMLLKKDGWIE